MVAVLNGINKQVFNEENLLFGISILGFAGVYFVMKISKLEQIPKLTEKRSNLREYDWKVIIRALVPTTIIAIGAGFTIPFMSLFFVSVHSMSTSTFSFLNFTTALLVTSVAIYVPKIKDRFGYLKAVTRTQLAAIFCLIIMATTQYYNTYFISIYIQGSIKVINSNIG